MAVTSTRRLELLTKGMITGLTALSLGVIWTAFLASSLGDRGKSEAAQVERLERSATSFATDLGHLMGDARLAMELLVRQVAAHPGDNAIRSREFLSMVQVIRYRSLEQIDLQGASADGNRLVFDGPPLNPPVSIADHAFFRQQVPFPGVGFGIDPPTRRPTGEWAVVVSQAVPPHQGDLAVLYVGLNLAKFDALVDLDSDAPSDTFAVYRQDGTLLFRRPFLGDYTNETNPSIASELRAAAATGLSRSTEVRAVHRIDDTSAWVVVSRPASLIGGDWERNFLAQLIWVGLLSLFVLISTVMLLRFMDRLRAIRLDQERLARSDPLTGLLNRRAFLERCELERNRALRNADPMCLLLLDLDRFKQVNDQFGHQEGDRVLKALADVLLSTLRTSDAVARIGGEEFAILLPATTLEAGLETAERIRAGVGTIALPEGFQTTSIGLALWDGVEAFDAWYQRTDRALYRAKEGGRNRVERAAEPGNSSAIHASSTGS